MRFNNPKRTAARQPAILGSFFARHPRPSRQSIRIQTNTYLNQCLYKQPRKCVYAFNKQRKGGRQDSPPATPGPLFAWCRRPSRRDKRTQANTYLCQFLYQHPRKYVYTFNKQRKGGRRVQNKPRWGRPLPFRQGPAGSNRLPHRVTPERDPLAWALICRRPASMMIRWTPPGGAGYKRTDNPAPHFGHRPPTSNFVERPHSAKASGLASAAKSGLCQFLYEGLAKGGFGLPLVQFGLTATLQGGLWQ